MHRCLPVLLLLLLLSMGCQPPKPIPGVVRPGPGEPFLEKIPGPLPGFGPFNSYSDALMAACPLILSKPNATAGRVGSQDFQLRWRVSSEYCAWLYYTPDHKYGRIVDYGVLHGFEVDTKSKKVQLGIIAFFSSSGDLEHPTCDGFFEYVPAVKELLKWTHVQGPWKPKRLGTVEWLNASEYRIHWE